MIRREETAGAIEIHNGKARRYNHGRIDYTLRIRLNPGTQPLLAVALIEAKAENLLPGYGLEQGKVYAARSRHRGRARVQKEKEGRLVRSTQCLARRGANFAANLPIGV